MKVREYRSFLSMVEILNKNKIYLNKSINKLTRNSAPKIIEYFKRGKHPMASSIVDLCKYYQELISHEKLEIV
jgi:uncharacterized protein YbgA (DUF1722 family)